MDQATYWLKQTPDKPLYPDMQWSRPENKLYAGKLLIVGGNLAGFSAPAEAYTEASMAGIGTARVLLPNALARTVGRVFEAGEYAPSTPSGSFSSQALGELLPMAHWADGVLLAGDLGRNSETAILLESFISKHAGQLTIAGEAAEYFLQIPDTVVKRPETLMVLSLAQLQKLAVGIRFKTAFTSDMDLLRFVDTLHAFTANHGVYIVTRHLGNVFSSAHGRVSSTRLPETQDDWCIKSAAHASVWWLQNPSKPFEALTTSII